MQFFKVLVLCFVSFLMIGVSRGENLPPEFYSKNIQPLFDNRCIACHSCFNAPCQLNLQSYEAFERGATKLNIYDGLRLKSVEPTRMWIDAHSTTSWRSKGFFSVSEAKPIEENLFLTTLMLRVAKPEVSVTKQVAASMLCPETTASLKDLASKGPELAMPYGFPPLDTQEVSQVSRWIAKGAPGPSSAEIKKTYEPASKTWNQAREWEVFLNGSSLNQQLVSRYIYEHMFLAHIFFPTETDKFFRLVRSKTSCRSGIEEVSSRRPNDDPGVKKFFYCLNPLKYTQVMKTHIPFEWSAKKLARYKEIFSKTSWQTKSLPGYEAGVAENPFVAFADIPVKARYEFLLEDSHYQVSTFIKGPVCNGSNAVNSIQEQFYVFFMDPDSDNMVMSKDYEKKVQNLLVLPGVFGSEVEIAETAPFYKVLIDHREKYRLARTEFLKQNKPQGYVLKDIWDGNENNPNAVLTVFRHDDNAVILKGAVGDLAKTMFVLDYPLLERLVYNLVVNFDVFGNVSHQLLTRIYMDMIRMEAEELFLAFLPGNERLKYRRQWYEGFLAQIKMKYIFPTVGSTEPTGVKFTNDEKDTKKQMVEKILFFHLNAKTRGVTDNLNWKMLEVPESLQETEPADRVQDLLKKITSVKAQDKTPFARYFPDTAYIKIQGTDKKIRVFTLIHNKEHENISFILGESLRMKPSDDSLTLYEGYLAPYPNMIFDLKESDLPGFTQAILKISSEDHYRALVQQFGVSRKHRQFWSHYDELNTHFRSQDKTNFGFLDLTRYELN